ncbi:hypothetical protein [Arcobacter sp. FWKO B]|uniref:hypothetical protein n=1 Tax=Arcobacter sp. FWKO B TaxID=2593672 RepID=UPI0018A3FF91|nr:hypothetical protein [Arcobacter sp. FWKO B]QOG12829.1 hypothetical protein FWKOB_09045 [Arcobacter sp. FWKO B]
MILDIISNSRYHNIVSQQLREIIQFLTEQGSEFGITANVKAVSFSPELPAVISEKLAPFPMFMLANYSFESIKIYDEYLEFEAGFGKENFGSIVKVPYVAIFQIVVDESILYINPVATQTGMFEDKNNISKSKSKLKLATKHS